ncbi:TKL protein kinase, variant 1 [Aphanomyces invadans]|uniref:TKL protein kinase, variant 1 n=1 Tax=Aphanomyces invadans TaxID=157072 RepID=A0A024TZP1_9STRA|nr:TKL protein kinase, variant 1 [Aphanomyces invadans]ETV99121.1 TKL protein kinase, variant 1 [Aphanomyces invadans]|eukprot:XP_008872548.1 TKL protein kinase, variant 1 [Aphanomyces invadans]
MIAQHPSSPPLPLRRSDPFLPPSPLPSPLHEPPKERSWSTDVRFTLDQTLTPAPAPSSTGDRQRTKALSDKRLLYRKWRTGSHRGASLSIIESIGPSANDATSSTLIPPRRPPSSSLSVIPIHSPSLNPTDPLLSPSNDHQIHGHTALTSTATLPTSSSSTAAAAPPLTATTHRDELDRRARELSERFLQDEDQFSQSSTVEALSGSFGKHGSSTPYPEMKKSRSHQGLSSLERAATMNPPKSSASGVQRGLKDSVMHDMCHAVVKQMVGDAISLTTPDGATRATTYHPATNHLYAPVLASVQTHFKQLPARYALSVDPDDVPMHMRLLANQKRRPDDIYLHAHFLKHDDGSINPTICEVVVVAQDRDSLLDAITRGLSSLKGSIQDADVMTTKDGVTLDRFVVKGSFVPPDRLAELRRRILENLARSTLAAEHSDKERQLQAAQQTASSAPTEAAPAPPTTTLELDAHSALRQSLNTTTIKPEWRLNFSELVLGKAVGTGRSGQTYSGSWRGTRVAIKLINLSHHNQSVSEEILQEFYREVAVVSRLRHPNIVLFLGASIEPPQYCLVFEYMENGALTDLIRRRRAAPIDFFRIAREIAMVRATRVRNNRTNPQSHEAACACGGVAGVGYGTARRQPPDRVVGHVA